MKLFLLLFWVTWLRAQDCTSTTEVLLDDGVTCADCSQLFGACRRCSHHDDSIGSIQCDECTDGLYLLTAKSQNLAYSRSQDFERVSLCVADCQTYSYEYVNNPNTMKCEYCGSGCQLCSMQEGCLASHKTDRGSRINNFQDYPSGASLFSDGSPSMRFSTSYPCFSDYCDECQTYDYTLNNYLVTQCDSCYEYLGIGIYTKNQLSQQVCDIYENTTLPHCILLSPENTAQCMACESGYYLDKQEALYHTYRTQCRACPDAVMVEGCARCSINQCLECESGYILVGGKCVACELDAFNDGFFVEPNRCTVCSEYDLTKCAYCDVGYLNSFTDPDSCLLTCDQGQYPLVKYTTVNNNENVILSTTCEVCDASCQACSGPDSTECLTCYSGFYLALDNTSAQTGTCLAQTLAVGVTHNIFVDASAAGYEIDSLSAKDIGSWTNPFWDIEYALIRAQELASKYYGGDVTINVYLFNTDFYVIQNRYDTQLIYRPVEFRPSGYNYRLNIQPLPCDFDEELDASMVCTDGVVTIYNKKRELFQVDIPAELTISNVKIDSLDSVLFSLDTLSDDCLNERRQCCTYLEGKIYTLDGLSTDCEDALEAYLLTQEAQCLVNQPRSLFKMQLDAASATTMNSFTMSGCEVTNMLYAVNSIVGLTPIGGIVAIRDSSFSSLNICGAVVKNWFEDVGAPQVVGYSNYEVLSESKRVTLGNLIGHSTAYNDNPNSIVCKADDCTSITLESTSFSDIPCSANTVSSYELVSSSNGLLRRGLIVSLSDFDGTLTVDSCTFDGLQIPFDSCDLTEAAQQQSVNNFKQQYSASSDFNQVQQTHLISVQGGAGDIMISSNTFTENVVSSALIAIQSKGTTTIRGNTFQSNGALLGAVVLDIRQCGSVTLRSNEFNYNSGCASTGTVLLQCIDNTDAYTYDEMFDTYTLVDGSTPTENTSVMLESNTFLGNVIGLDKHVVSIEGVYTVSLSSTKFTNNENYLPQIFKSLSPLASLIDTLPTNVYSLDKYAYKAQAILRVAASASVTLNSVTFYQNWIADHQSYFNEYQGICLIQDLVGSLELDTVTFEAHQGVKASSLAQMKGEGARSGILVFKDLTLSSVTMNGLIFEDNQLYWSSDTALDTGVVEPRLFSMHYGQLEESSTRVLFSNLDLVGNKFYNSPCAVKLSLFDFNITKFQISRNNGSSIVCVDIQNDNEEDFLYFDSGTIKSNKVANGAVFYFKEASDFVFESSDLAPSKTSEPETAKLHFTDCDFSYNEVYEDVGQTSCVQITKTAQRRYPWLSLRFETTTFTSNKGTLTSAIYYSEGIVSWFVMVDCDFSVYVATASPGRLAQVLYKRDEFSYLRVQDSSFTCNLDYESSVIKMYDLEGVQGRPSLFRIYDTGEPVRLSALQLNSTRDKGTANQEDFKNIFTNNVYSYCNQMDRGAVFYLESGAQVFDSYSDFNYLSALEGGVAYLDGDSSYLTIYLADQVRNCRAYNGGMFYVTNGATVHVLNQTYLVFSEAYEGTVAYLTQRGRLLLTDTVYVRNMEAYKGGMISVYNGGQFWLDKVYFQNCDVQLQSAIINIDNGREQYHLMDGSTRITYGVWYKLRSFINNCEVSQASVFEKGRLISVTEGSLFINSTLFHDNDDIVYDNFGIAVFGGELTLIDSNFTGDQNSALQENIYQRELLEINGGFVAAYGITQIKVTNSGFDSGRGTYGGCVALFGQSTSEFRETRFKNCAGMLGGAIYADAFAQLRIYDSIFENNKAFQGQGQNIYAVGGTGVFHIERTKLFSFYTSVYVQSHTINIFYCTFQGTNSGVKGVEISNGGAVYIDWALNTNIQNSEFYDMKAVDGGAIYYAPASKGHAFALEERDGRNKNYNFELKSCNFIRCSAENNGGSLFFRNTEMVKVRQGTFVQSKAGEYGGAIYFWCDPVSLQEQAASGGITCELNLANEITFTDCSARQGGGLYWNFIEPTITPADDKSKAFVQVNQDEFYYQQLKFVRCTATEYGPQIAAVAQELAQISKATYNKYYGFGSQDILPFSKRMNVTSQKPLLTDYRYGGVQSGGNVPISWFCLLDQYGQVVSPNSGRLIKFNLEQTEPLDGFNTDITGMKDFYSMNGMYLLDNMGILSKPGIELPVSIIVDSVDIRVPSVRNYLERNLGKQIRNFGDYKINIIMKVRPCILGEGLKESGACFTCPTGSYLLTIPTQPTDCEVCNIEKSICLGGSDIGPKPGWWRLSNETYFFIPCKIESACLGKNPDLPADTPGNPTGLCDVANGYHGVLCTACLPKFKRSGLFECDKCLQLEPYFTVGAFIIIIVAVCLLVTATINGAASANNTHSVFNKILMNHMQMLLITASFDMSWPTEVQTIFSLAAPIAELTSSITSFDCYMDQRDPSEVDPYDFYADPWEIRIVYQKLFIMASMPVILALASYVGWWVVLKIKRKMIEHQTRFIASLVLCLFLVHPSITQSMIDMFNCQDLDGELRLTVDLQVTCYEGLHTYMAYCLALPCLLMWGLGIPATVLIMMRREADKMDTVAVKQKFGFLYNGYKRHNYYWEIVIMYRKIMCIFIAVFLNRVGIIVQALVLLILLVIFLQANANARPFAFRALNDIEGLSLSTQIVTIYCGIFFISAKDRTASNFDTNKDFYLSSQGKLVFFSVIAFCNVSFVLLWIVKFIGVIKVLIKDKYPRIYTIFFLCGRKDKMNLENVRRARDIKKEAIIESIEAVTLQMQKMKRLYSNNVYYEDHTRFLKLLYYIEYERKNIDLTEKRHNYYIQGPMARSRRFDPEVVAENKNLAEIKIDQSYIYQPGTSATLRGQIEGGFLNKSKISKIQIDRSQQNQTALTDKGSEMLDRSKTPFGESSYLLLKHDQSGTGKDLLEVDDKEGSQIERLKDSTQKPQIKKKQRRKNVADLQENYLLSRNLAKALATETKSHIKAANVSALDGSIIKPKLPPNLRGFQLYDQQTEVVNESGLERQDSVQENLYIVRQLTARTKVLAEQSPQKSPGKSFQSQRTGAEQSQVSEHVTVIDAQSMQSREDQINQGELPVFHPEESDEDLRKPRQERVTGLEIIVSKDGGGKAPDTTEQVEPQEQVRLRPKIAVRHQLVNGLVVAVDHAVQPLHADDDLMITILDEDCNYVEKKQKKAKKETSVKPQKIAYVPASAQPSDPEAAKNETESFQTDPSMKDFDIMQPEPGEYKLPPDDEEEKQQQSERVEVESFNQPLSSRRSIDPDFMDNQRRRPFEKPQATKPQIGDGLLYPELLAPPNFHPKVTSGHLFSASQSLRSDLSESELNSRRDILIKPKLKTGNLSNQSSNN